MCCFTRIPGLLTSSLESESDDVSFTFSESEELEEELDADFSASDPPSSALLFARPFLCLAFVLSSEVSCPDACSTSWHPPIPR